MMRFDFVWKNACRKGQPFRTPISVGRYNSTRVDEGRTNLDCPRDNDKGTCRSGEGGGRANVTPDLSHYWEGGREYCLEQHKKWNEEMRGKKM